MKNKLHKLLCNNTAWSLIPYLVWVLSAYKLSCWCAHNTLLLTSILVIRWFYFCNFWTFDTPLSPTFNQLSNQSTPLLQYFSPPTPPLLSHCHHPGPSQVFPSLDYWDTQSNMSPCSASFLPISPARGFQSASPGPQIWSTLLLNNLCDFSLYTE